MTINYTKRLMRGALFCALLIGYQAEIRPAANDDSSILSVLDHHGLLTDVTLGVFVGSAVGYCMLNPIEEYGSETTLEIAGLGVGYCATAAVLMSGTMYGCMGVIKLLEKYGIEPRGFFKDFFANPTAAGYLLGSSAGLFCEFAFHAYTNTRRGGRFTEEGRVNRRTLIPRERELHAQRVAQIAALQPQADAANECQRQLDENPYRYGALLHQAGEDNRREYEQLTQEYEELTVNVRRLEESIEQSRLTLPDSFALPASSSSHAASSSSSSSRCIIG